MTENNSSDPANQEPQPGSNDPNQQPAKPKKKRRWILKTLLSLVILVILLVLLAPTILGLGIIRETVVGQINSSALNGKLQIKDWSFGWTSGVHLEGVELQDANSIHLLSVGQIDVPISLIKAATGNIDLGDVIIKDVDFNAQIDSSGQLNFLGAMKPSKSQPSSGPSKLPNVKGTIHIQNVTGTFQDDAAHLPTIALPQQAPLNATITIKDINQPIVESVDLGLQLAEQNLVKIKVDGSVSAIANNLVDPSKLTADQTIQLSEGDLAAVSSVLHAMHLDLDVMGKMDGKITATVNTMDNISATMAINLADASAGGKQLSGDTLALQSGQIGLTASVVSTNGQNARIKLDMPVTLQPRGAAKADQANVHVDVAQDSLMGTAAVAQAITAHLAKTPGVSESTTIPGQGDIKISANFDVANWVNQVPHLVPLEKGTSLTSGTLSHETTVTIGGGQAVVATETKLIDFAGTTSGQPVRVSDIDAKAGLAAVGGDHPDLRDVNVSMTSAFANVTGGGPTIGKLNIDGSSDLKNLQQQVSQIVDLDAMLHAPAGSHVSLAGTLGFKADTNGDFTADNSDIATGASFTATAVNITIPGRRAITEPNFAASISATLHHTAAQFVQAVNDLKISVQSPAVNFAASGSATLAGRFGVEIPSLKITQGTIDPRLVQEEFGGALSLFVPPAAADQTPTLMQRIADNSVRVASGSINISGEMKFDSTGFGFPQPLSMQVQPMDLAVTDDMGTVQTTHVPQVSLTVSGNGAVNQDNVAAVKNLSLSVVMGSSDSPLFDLELSADADVSMSPTGAAPPMSMPRFELGKLDGDLPGLQNALGPLLPLVAPPPPVAANAQPSVIQLITQNVLVCTSGKLSGSMLASCDGQKMTIEKPLTISIADLTLQQRGAGSNMVSVINDETIRLALSASLDSQMSAVHDLNLTLGTSLAKSISITNGQFVLATRQDGKLVPVGTFGMVNSLDVEVDGADLARLDAVANSLFNQAATPAPGETAVVIVPPPQVTSGVASVKINLSRSGDTLTANISQALVHGLAIKSNGSTTRWPHDITAQLSATVNSSDDARQLLSAAVNSLTVDSGVGTTIGLINQKPVVADHLNDPANMSVQGGVRIVGDIAPLARVAEAFAGAKPNSYPYQGHFDLSESLAKIASQPRLQISGGGAITQFVVMSQPGPNGAAAAPLFSESNITLQNPLQFDFGTFSVVIDPANPIAVALNSTGAAGVSVSGTINSVEAQCQISDDNPVVIKLSYDLAKLWPIVKPLLSPSTQQTLADLTITGQEQRQIKATGSFPLTMPFNEAIKKLSVRGYLTVGSLSTQGITLTGFDFPFVLRSGIVRTVYPDLPEGQNWPHPAQCNGGTLDIGVMKLDLTKNPMLLSMPYVNSGTPKYLLQNVSLNPAMSKSVMGKFLNNPAFVNANQAQGLLSLEITHLDQIPLSGLLTQSSPQNKGTAVIIYSVTGLQLGSELLAVFGSESVSADINNATVKYANGIVNEDTTMMIDGNKPLRFAGSVVLATEQFAPMTVYIPPALFDRLIPGEDQAYVPDVVVVPMKGDMNHPKLDLGQAIAQTVKQGAKKAIINGLLQGLQHVH